MSDDRKRRQLEQMLFDKYGALLSAPQLAEVLGISPSSVRDGRPIPSVSKPPKQRRYRYDQVAAHILDM